MFMTQMRSALGRIDELHSGHFELDHEKVTIIAYIFLFNILLRYRALYSKSKEPNEV